MNQELERFEPAELGGRIAYEHLHRYAICRDRVAGLRVLDVACGAGYGTNLLAQTAAQATGLDIDPAAIRRAKKVYKAENLKFVTADCLEMPFEPGSFDVVVANEMIEHIAEQDAFIEEVKRVLVAGGRLLVSTPNKPVYNRYKPPNPFHVAEMDLSEFRRLLKRHFKLVQLTGLRMALVSSGYEIEGSHHPSNLIAAKTYRGVGSNSGRPEVNNDELAFDDPEYVLATCSDRPFEDAPTASSIFFSNEDDLWVEHEKIMSWASQLHEEDEVLRTDLRQSRADLEAAESALERERLAGDKHKHLTVSAKLLGRLTRTTVEADEIAIVDAMFSLNEEMVTQRAQLDRLVDAEKKLLILEKEFEVARATHESALDGLRRQHDEARERLTSELERLRDTQAAQLAELEAARGEVRQARERHDERDRAAREAEQKQAALETELKETKAAIARLTIGQDSPKSDPDNGGMARSLKSDAGASRQLRRRSRLIASYHEIQHDLGRATEAMRAAIPTARPRSRRRALSRGIFRKSQSEKSIPFDRAWIERQAPGARSVSVLKFLQDPQFFGVDPHPLFSAAYYMEQNPDVAEAGISAFGHYLEHGWREGRDPHPYFANDWYLYRNPDVLHAGVNPLVQYLEHGWKEGRFPNPAFDPTAYLNAHPDVETAGLEPLTHFVVHGSQEGRATPFRGLERDWHSLVARDDSKSLLDFLLSKRSDVSPPRAPTEVDDDTWPPQPLNNFWLPQTLRDFMIERQRENLIPLFTYLYSVMDAYAEAPGEFPDSDACRRILDRIRALSSEMGQDGTQSPEVTIVIPVYNNILDTLLCVVSLLESGPAIPIEILIADDCSTDATERLISDIGGVVRHVRNSINKGFVANCNAAAEHARGQQIVLLNNDTLIFSGWLENLVAPFSQFERVGLVGSKLINWDGSLQEAGGILWADGSAWNFGRGQDPAGSEFNYLKDVDYCSGASIAVSSSVWRQLGGFDPAFAPAYCEDSDLAFRVREAGYRTLYAPHSELIHHEGRSHGRDTGTGIKAQQVINQRRLFDRWQDVLERDQFANGEKVLRARDRSAEKPHILVIDHYVPQFDRDAGSRTMLQFLQTLIAAGWAVTFWPENLHYDARYTPAIQDMGVEVIYGPKFVAGFSEFLKSRSGLYDAVLLSRPHVASQFIDDVRALSDAQILYYGHDIHFERMRAQREVAGSTIEESAVEDMRELELGVCNRCDVILYPSEDEARRMAELVAPTVRSEWIPAYCYSEADLQAAARVADRSSQKDGSKKQLLFVGGFAHGPNSDGIAWFCREVAPILRASGIDFEVQIAGSNPTPEVWELEADDVRVLGFVSDDALQQLYRNASAVIAPLRFGAGVKGKVVEAMARGVPVVTTHVGAQGLATAEDYLFVGDSPEEFASGVIAAMDSDVATSRAKLALDYIRSAFSQSAMTDVLKEVLPSNQPVFKTA